MSKVFVLDTDKKPLDPIHPGYARRLLTAGKAAVFKRYPFIIILKYATKEQKTDSYRVKIDPGSKTSGLAIVNDDNGEVVWAAELTHRSQQIKAALLSRSQIRRNRRNRKTRYRKARFFNRHKPKGNLLPSLMSRVYNITTWVWRLRELCPITSISMELTKFDTQAIQKPEICRIEYQQGELYGYEVREYLLEKWGRKCAYCGKENVPLQVEHIIPKSRGGGNRVSNLTISCASCNLKKGAKTATEFGYPDIQNKAKLPLKDAAAMNAIRWALFRELQSLGLPVECGSGGRTKWNRIRLGLPKAHWIDATCVGASTPDTLCVKDISPLLVKAVGHGNRQMCQTDKYGFPKSHRTRRKVFDGFRTGDIVKAIVPSGKYAGIHIGKVTVRVRHDWSLNGMWFHRKYFNHLQKADGYVYTY